MQEEKYINEKKEAVEYFNKGNILIAENILKKVHSKDTSDINTINLLSMIYIHIKEWNKALLYLRKIQLLDPKNESAHYNCGNIFQEIGEFEKSLESYNKAIDINKNNIDAYINRSIAYNKINKFKEAIESLHSAIKIDNNNFEAYNTLGNIFAENKKYDEALYYYNQAIEKDNGAADTYNNKGNVLRELGGYNLALICYDKALELNKNHLSANFNKAILLKENKQLEESLIYLNKTLLIINNNDEEILCIKGQVLRELCRGKEARESFKRAIEINNSNVEAHWAIPFTYILPLTKEENVIKSRSQLIIEIDVLNQWIKKSQKLLLHEAVGSTPTFYLAYNEFNNKSILKLIGGISTEIMQKWSNEIIKEKINLTKKNKKIQIGIVGEQIYDHSVWNAITKGIVLNINKEIFEINIFKLGKKSDDETNLAKINSNIFIDSLNTLEEWCKSISSQDLDILIYPEIGMHQLTIQLASMRLAPLQIASWGHPETTGLPTIDYFISAELFEDENSVNNYSEKLIKLANLGSYYYKKKKYIINNNNQIEIQKDQPILICAGALFKYLPEYDWILIEIIKKIGKCKLIFFQQQNEWQKILYERLKFKFAHTSLNIDEYIIFIPFLNTDEFITLLKKSTLYLDSIGFSGFNTAITAIECDIPLVTLNGKFMRGRLAAGILKRIGLEELVAKNEIEYIQIVYKLIKDVAYRRKVKEIIISKREIVFNDIESIKSLEIFLKNIIINK